MKVMLTPPDLWGSTGYVSGGGGSGCVTPDQMYKERGEADLQWGTVCTADNKETENIIMINRQRQVRWNTFKLLRGSYLDNFHNNLNVLN